MPTFRRFNGSDCALGGHLSENQIDIGSVPPSAFAGGYSRSWGNAMKIPRRHFLHLAAGAAALPGLPDVASALDYPTRPVRLIAAWPAGSGPDVVARLAGQWLSERFAQQFIVDDRPGASGNIGTEVVVKASPDGYTLLMAVSPNAINSTLYPNLKVNFSRDIAPVASFARTAFVMEVNPTVPARTIPEFISYAKDNPGKITMASGGNGSTTHVAGELFKVMTGIDMLHVPYRANPLPDLLGGQVQVYFSPIASSIGYIRTGKLRALAVTSETRSEALPDVPTIAETVPGYEGSGWYGLVAPKDTPPEVIGILNRGTNDILANQQTKQRLIDVGTTAFASSPADFGKFIAAEIDKWAKVIKLANIESE
jgi:tripartite-type tricarboxylate transporter receptor subunit TctC